MCICAFIAIIHLHVDIYLHARTRTYTRTHAHALTHTATGTNQKHWTYNKHWTHDMKFDLKTKRKERCSLFSLPPNWLKIQIFNARALGCTSPHKTHSSTRSTCSGASSTHAREPTGTGALKVFRVADQSAEWEHLPPGSSTLTMSYYQTQARLNWTVRHRQTIQQPTFTCSIFLFLFFTITTRLIRVNTFAAGKKKGRIILLQCWKEPKTDC